MALDRFVYWKSQRPTIEEIQRCLEDYVAGLAVSVERWQDDRFGVTLPGYLSFPLTWTGLATDAQRAAVRELQRSRWFEVYVGSDHIDVITRQMDEITNNVARGFAELMARGWDGDFKE